MTHTYPVRIRWSDLDVLDHVTNVVYADLATDALGAMERDGLLPHGDLVSLALDYLAPLELDHEDVRVESVVRGGAVDQVIHSSTDGTPLRAATMRAELGVRAALTSDGPGTFAWDQIVRPSDLGPSGLVAPGRIFTYFQEARAQLQMRARTPEAGGATVVVHSECHYGVPLGWRTEPYLVSSWVGDITRSSITVLAELTDGETVHARGQATVVGFDRETGRSRPLTGEERERISAFQRP
ncbi:MAG: thioesterase family protein [Aeromicrobium sp.]